MAGRGRPTTYDPDVMDRILERIEDGEALRVICSEPGMPSRGAVRNWIDAIEGLKARHEHARARGLEVIAEQVITLADEQIITERGDDNVARSKLMIESRKWTLSKLAPKIYGDKTAHEVTGADGAPLPVMVYLPSNERERETPDD